MPLSKSSTVDCEVEILWSSRNVSHAGCCCCLKIDLQLLAPNCTRKAESLLFDRDKLETLAFTDNFKTSESARATTMGKKKIELRYRARTVAR